MMNTRKLSLIATATFLGLTALPRLSSADSVYSYVGVELYSATTYSMITGQILSSYGFEGMSTLTLDLRPLLSMTIGSDQFNYLSSASFTSDPFSATGSGNYGDGGHYSIAGNFAITDTTAVADITTIGVDEGMAEYSIAYDSFQTVPEPSSLALVVSGAVLTSICAAKRRLFAS
jgi:hypothetical protein